MGHAYRSGALRLVFCLLGAGCVDDAQQLGANNEDAGEPEFCALESGAFRVGAGLISGEPSGCNQCLCGNSGQTTCPDGGCRFLCTAGLCRRDADAGTADGAEPRPPRGPRYPRCLSNAECGNVRPSYDVCAFNAGCENPSGFCISAQSFCREPEAVEATPEDESVYCGCDGKTYRGPCPKVPYRHSGPCGGS